MRRIFCFIFCIFLICSCSQKPRTAGEAPRTLSGSYKISVAPFTQPLSPAQLITGQIPDNQGKIPADSLIALDRQLREVLISRTNRNYNFIPRRNFARDLTSARSTTQPSALDRWLEYGKEHNAQLLLVPQILDWHEREGSQAGVTESAHVRAEFYLLNIPESMATGRSIFEEKQVGLIENLLTVGDFIKRKGQWVTAETLAGDGMLKAIRDLGL